MATLSVSPLTGVAWASKEILRAAQATQDVSYSGHV